jgi:vacuolar protein sorting-associated protein 54
MREFVRRHLNPKQAVMLIEFDKLKRDFQEHQNEIHAKLVAIMADRLAVHCASLKVSSRQQQSRLERAILMVKLLPGHRLGGDTSEDRSERLR